SIVFDEVSSNTITAAAYAAATKLNSFGNHDLAFLKFDLASGNLLYEKFWHDQQYGGNEEVAGISISPLSGTVYVAGRIASQTQNQKLAVWGYDDDALSFALTVAGHTRGRAVASGVSGDTYLATNSTAPYKFVLGDPLTGAEGPQAAPLVLGSAITFPASGATITGLTTISGTASQASVVEVSIQGPDGYWSGSAYGTLQTWFTAAGTSNWSLTPSYGVNSASGTYVVASRAKDSGGMYQSGTTSISISRLPVVPANITVLSRSSTSFEVAFTPNGNPPDQKYHFHYGTAPSCGEAYFNGCPPGLCNDYVSGTTRTISVGYGNASLSPNTSYFFQIHTEYDGTGGV
ncbi:MAG: hypothetical protein AAB578_08135, partial [Elusimicrobiota bacterium]